MAPITRITKAYVRQYRDNGQVTVYVEWVDARGRAGRTEGPPDGAHMRELFLRAEREGVVVERQVW